MSYYPRESILNRYPVLFFILFCVLGLAALIGFGVAISPTGDGQFSGKLIGVSYEGLIWKSCEIEQQVGSTRDASSTLDKELCAILKSKIGEEVTIDYERVKFSLRTDTPFIIRSVK